MPSIILYVIVVNFFYLSYERNLLLTLGIDVNFEWLAYADEMHYLSSAFNSLEKYEYY